MDTMILHIISWVITNSALPPDAASMMILKSMSSVMPSPSTRAIIAIRVKIPVAKRQAMKDRASFRMCLGVRFLLSNTNSLLVTYAKATAAAQAPIVDSW